MEHVLVLAILIATKHVRLHAIGDATLVVTLLVPAIVPVAAQEDVLRVAPALAV